MENKRDDGPNRLIMRIQTALNIHTIMGYCGAMHIDENTIDRYVAVSAIVLKDGRFVTPARIAHAIYTYTPFTQFPLHGIPLPPSIFTRSDRQKRRGKI